MIPCGNPNEITHWSFGSETPRPSSEATKTPSWRISSNIVPIRHGYRSILDSRHLQLRILCPAAYLSSSNGSHTNFYLFFVSHQMTRTALHFTYNGEASNIMVQQLLLCKRSSGLSSLYLYISIYTLIHISSYMNEWFTNCLAVWDMRIYMLSHPRGPDNDIILAA